jgi:iron complex transport system ATP-binding protein
MMNDVPLILEGLHVTARRRTILQVDALRVHAGELLAVLGPNGAGKTTLLRVCTGFFRPSAGSVTVLGQPLHMLSPLRLTALRQRIGYVPQLQSVGGEMPLTLREIVAIGRTGIRGLLRPLAKDDWHVIDDWMERLGLARVARHPYSEASGGEQRKALIARALVQEPGLLLLDEPTAHLDMGAREQVVQTLQDLHEQTGLTIVLVCHELEVIPPACRRVLLLDRGQVRADGTPENVFTDECVQSLYGARLSVLHQDGRHGVFPRAGGQA